ncbi:MAG: hypothetical protein OEZ33_03350, partial [Gammaproteobacteria bacterium]|nr:hypothetical protein [Gammaproteobacteria bacterium]
MGVSLTHCYKRICVLLLVFFSASHYALASDEARSGKHKYPDDLVNVVPGENFTAAIDEDGELWLWGDFSALGLSNSVITYRNKKGNIRFSQLRNDSRGRDIVDDISAIALGKEHILMLKTNGSLWSVGKNTFGQLGTGDNQNQEFPVEIDLALFAIPAIKQIVSGVYHNVIVAGDDNLVYAWGSNANGQLGNAGSQNVNSPTAVVDSDGNQLNQVTQISTKGEHNLAIRGIDNNLWVWGKNLDGELGLGHNENTFVATQVMIDE